MKNGKLLIFNKYMIIFLFIFFLLGIGGTYAYYAFQIESDTTTIVGNVVSIDVDLDVELVVGTNLDTNTKMVPLLDRALSNALKGEGSDNGACVDSLGNLSCQVYKITLTNNGSKISNIAGSIELYAKEGTNNVYNNLKWRELTDTATIREDVIVNGMNKSILVSDLTMKSKTQRIWYIAVWISEQDYDQRETDKGLFGGTVTFEPVGSSEATVPINAPNLDNGNLLPVYYDDKEKASDGTYGVWKKADSTNANNSWYDYENKMWANAVIISEDATTDYSSNTVRVGTTIADNDIIAFYVWIPRYKYRVWNITRQGGAEDTYAYPAYSTGIEIQFETGTASTGNVECTYDVQTNGSATYLSDNCKVNGTSVVYGVDNRNYVGENEAWYTHPAFTFGIGTDKEKEGFWVGKFETSGTENSTTGIADTPTILPDVISLREQTVSEQFMTAKNFQNYLSSDSTIDAHMLTNLEWGAVAYLTHSNYGLCTTTDNGITCQGVYHNNSSGYFTGRSMGNIATSVTSSTYGTYDYKGYKLDSAGKSTSEEDKNVSLVASTTGNVTGVYDISGGAYEYVMGNMVNSSKKFYSSSAGNKWNNTNWYDYANKKGKTILVINK